MTIDQYIVAQGRGPHLGDKDYGGNILFCWIQKVGCTNFKKLFKPLSIHIRAAVPNGNEWTPNKIVNSIMHNTSWHKAVFYREPLERFLSGYLDKCIKEYPHGTYCQRVFGKKDATFDEAVRVLITQNPDALDGHFHSQIDFCGGLRNTISHFDTVEMLQPETSREKVEEMLRLANITSPNFDQQFPGLDRPKDKHQMQSSKKLESYYNNTQHVGIVVNFFYEDYILFGIPLPEFALRALLELNRTKDEFMLSSEKLDRLLKITRDDSGGKDIQIQTEMESGDIHHDISNQEYYSYAVIILYAIIVGYVCSQVWMRWKKKPDTKKL